MNQVARFPRHSLRRFAAGFTLIELLVVVAIIALIIAILLPAVQRVREESNEADTADNLKQIGIAVHAFQVNNGTLPGTIARTDPFWSGISRTRQLDFSGSGDTLIGAGYEIAYLPGEGLFALSAEPVEPGLTGSNALLLTAVAGTPPADDDISSHPLDEADGIRQAALDKIRDCGLQSIAELLLEEGDEETARLVKGGVLDEENQDLAFAALDADLDGEVTLAEICANDDAPLPPDLIQCICQHLRIGAGGENLAKIGVRQDALQGDPANLLSFEDVCLFTTARVDKPGVTLALCQKLMAAAAAEAAGDLETRDDALAAFQNHVAAQSGKAIEPDDADQLQMLAEILKAQ